MAKNLREEFKTLQDEGLAVIEAARTAGRDMTDEETAANEKRFTRLKTIERTIAEEDKFTRLKLANEIEPEVRTAIVDGNAQPGAKFSNGKDGAAPLTFEQKQRQAINNYARFGVIPSPDHEMFTIVSGNGGIVLPATTPIVLKRLSNPIKQALLARGLNLITTPGYENIPIFDDTANIATVIAQNTTTENDVEPTVTNFLPGNVLYDSGTIFYSNTILTSLAYDLFAYTEPMLNKRIELAETVAWIGAMVNGTSAGGNTITAATVGYTTAHATAITWEELVSLKYSIPPALIGDAVFIFSVGMMNLIESLADANNRPIYRDSLTDNAPDTLLGIPIFITDQLAAPGANAITGIIASASSIAAREAGGRRVTRYQNESIRRDQTGLAIYCNGGFTFSGYGVKLLKMGAS